MDNSDAELSVPALQGDYTTVVATTLGDDAGRGNGNWTSAQDVPIEQDALNRCIYAIREMVRTYRATFEVTCVLPSYELLDISIPYQVAPSAVVTEDGNGFSLDRSEWGSVGLLTLDHTNIPDAVQGSEVGADDKHRLDYFNELMNRGNPLFVWRERFVEARRALNVEGQYGAAVTLSNTASEVLLDSLLASLMWESGKESAAVADVFAEGRLAKRVKSQFSELLGGVWVLDGTGPVAEWFHKCYRVRHRVVHSGYSPSRLEAQVALDSVHQLSRHCWDRLAVKRKKFPRTALMLLAEEGLRRRGKWCSFMKHFSSEIAPREDSWLRQSQKWREDVQTLLMSSE
ncbi:hypothetical protein HTV45_32625 [Streptomyces sp. CHD11]|uniref:hypothetical protein n=1 Tax=Streptomyces sp. CHD11 TaxID=2741325 RepID=UPI001BFCC726|nr:hypothetical protein [Streptomyces sp. CHD11]MBT3155531.1 hypothetical protein [Streptomyces sp. CHD11]